MSLVFRLAKGLNCFGRMCSGVSRTSLVADTLISIENDDEFKETSGKLQTFGQKRLTLEERKIRRRALDMLDVPNFNDFVGTRGLSVTRKNSKILQLNIGLYCNQACNHCHVESSPKRKEVMTQAIVDRCFHILDNSPSITTLDITGGAPELNPGFRDIVRRGRERGLEVIDRCNLTALMEPGEEDLAQFLADHQVRVVASLPCYSERNVNLQRGRGVFSRSILGLQALNELGYGVDGGDLLLDLVYNPAGPSLPPNQHSLEAEYKDKLRADFNISFNSLLTLSNMPIKRFADLLHRRGQLEEYMTLLVQSFNPSTVEGVMCSDTVSVSWEGKIYDCDFNQQLQLEMGSQLTPISAPPASREGESGEITAPTRGLSVFDIDSVDDIMEHKIVTDLHCFGCTAGAGSSCQGATT